MKIIQLKKSQKNNLNQSESLLKIFTYTKDYSLLISTFDYKKKGWNCDKKNTNVKSFFDNILLLLEKIFNTIT